MSQFQLGTSFQERYTNFFAFFSSSPKTIQEIKSFISENALKNYSSSYNKIHLNMIDINNLNILFHIVRTSKSDKDCLEKLKLLIEEYNINYNTFDKKHRRLPFYTCVKGYLLSTQYLIEKMNFDIALRDTNGETIFFSAIRSYNIELVKYLNNKFPKWIFMPNNGYSCCIFNIFKKSMKDEGETKIKNLMKFIVEKGFDLEQKNGYNLSFKDLCISEKVINYLNDVIKANNDNNNMANHYSSNKDISNSSDSTSNISNINLNIKKKEKKESIIKKEENKINSLNSNNSSKPKLKINGHSMNNNKKGKLKCCVFETKKKALIINKIFGQLSSNEELKKNYYHRVVGNIDIPVFEKGKINLIEKSLAQEEQK